MTLRNGHDYSNITSLDDARRRASVKLNAAPPPKSSAKTAKTMTARDWVWGGLLIAMAIGFVVSFFLGATGPINGGSV